MEWWQWAIIILGYIFAGVAMEQGLEKCAPKGVSDVATGAYVWLGTAGLAVYWLVT